MAGSWFLRHPGEGVTRQDLQNALGISKATCCRLMKQLTSRLSLEVTHESNMVYYTLTKEASEALIACGEVLCSMKDQERAALTYLIAGRNSSLLLPGILNDLAQKLTSAGLIPSRRSLLYEWKGLQQEVKEENKVYVESLFSAAENLTEIAITYKKLYKEEAEEYVLEPVGLFVWDGNLYLLACLAGKGEARTFAFSRILSIDVHNDKHFERHSEVDLEERLKDPFGVKMDDPVRVCFTVSPHQALYEREKKWPADAVLTDLPDGSLKVEVSTESHWAFKRWALSLGKDIKVEKPESLAKQIKKEHEASLDLYLS